MPAIGKRRGSVATNRRRSSVTVAQLKEICKQNGIKRYSNKRKDWLLEHCKVSASKRPSKRNPCSSQIPWNNSADCECAGDVKPTYVRAGRSSGYWCPEWTLPTNYFKVKRPSKRNQCNRQIPWNNSADCECAGGVKPTYVRAGRSSGYWCPEWTLPSNIGYNPFK